jgi:hypothetical protein
MADIVSLPSRSVTLVNNVEQIHPPFRQGQVVLAVELYNGVRVEASWNEYEHAWTAVAWKGTGEAKVTLTSRTTANPRWLPGIVRSLAWSYEDK